MNPSPPIPPLPDAPRLARRRLLVGAALCAAPIGAAFAQRREGVQVGRPSQLSALAPSSEQVEAQAARQYHEMLQEAQAKHMLAPVSHPQVTRLNYIAGRLRPFASAWNARAPYWQWEVNLIGSQQLNAFCMPGGKIAFFWGILTKLKLSDDEVAMIMGHEMTHALRDHAREQMGKQAATQSLIGLGAAIFGLGVAGRQVAGMGGQLLSLKYSRDDETEADLIGLELAARAGYEPRSALSLWHKMEEASRGAPPAFLSDHPSNPDRMDLLRNNIPNVAGLYERSPKPDLRYGPPASAAKAGGNASAESR